MMAVAEIVVPMTMVKKVMVTVEIRAVELTEVAMMTVMVMKIVVTVTLLLMVM